MLVEQVESGQSRVEIAYKRGVQPEGNQQALKLMEQVFEPCPARWRGIGEVADSGLKLKQEYRRFDAEANFDIEPGPTVEHAGCVCGDILRGVKTPADCKLFGKACTPENPVGPCMVSTEGSCSAYYLYGGGVGG
jgi:hydrogenase expression/formation protein HypD